MHIGKAIHSLHKKKKKRGKKLVQLLQTWPHAPPSTLSPGVMQPPLTSTIPTLRCKIFFLLFSPHLRRVPQALGQVLAWLKSCTLKPQPPSREEHMVCAPGPADRAELVFPDLGKLQSRCKARTRSNSRNLFYHQEKSHCKAVKCLLPPCQGSFVLAKISSLKVLTKKKKII